MLLWVLILALFGGAVALFGGNLPANAQGTGLVGAGPCRGSFPVVHRVRVKSV